MCCVVLVGFLLRRRFIFRLAVWKLGHDLRRHFWCRPVAVQGSAPS